MPMPDSLPFRQRQLTEPEIRLLRSRAALMRRSGRRATSASLWVGLGAIVLLWALTLIASDSPALIVTLFWLVVGVAIILAVRRSMQADGRQLQAVAAGLESALRRNLAEVYDIRATGFVEFEEIEDEGACYAFELPGGRLVFLQGQEFYGAADFPSLDFSLVMPLDESGRRVDMFIEKRGRKAEPQRTIPAAFKRELEIPDDLELLTGTLERLEERLRARR
jgi:hypothetical protein